MSFHTFGDSHSLFGWDDTNIIKHPLGPILCYSFGKEKLNRCDIRKFNVKDGDSICFCFGEIDCRCHIHKYITPQLSYQDIINNIIDDYFDAIELNIKLAKVKLMNICVYNVVPPIQKHNTIENLQYPYLGTDEDRKNYVLYFNKKLKEKCSDKKYIFFDVYNKYTDANGFLNKNLSDGIVHIKNNIYIQEFIQQNKLL